MHWWFLWWGRKYAFYILCVIITLSKKKKWQSLCIHQPSHVSRYQWKANDWTSRDYNWDRQEITFLKHHVNEFSTRALSARRLMMSCDTRWETMHGFHFKVSRTGKRKRRTSCPFLGWRVPLHSLWCHWKTKEALPNLDTSWQKNPAQDADPPCLYLRQLGRIFPRRYDNRWALYLL